MVIKSSIWAFPIGVAFSGVLAITARGRPFDKLSLPRFAALGAGGGLLLFGLLAVNAWQAWSVSDAIANLALLTLLGGGSATATLMIARRAGPARWRLATNRAAWVRGRVVGTPCALSN
jgi:hypothetical protein